MPKLESRFIASCYSSVSSDMNNVMSSTCSTVLGLIMIAISSLSLGDLYIKSIYLM